MPGTEPSGYWGKHGPRRLDGHDPRPSSDSTRCAMFTVSPRVCNKPSCLQPSTITEFITGGRSPGPPAIGHWRAGGFCNTRRATPLWLPGNGTSAPGARRAAGHRCGMRRLHAANQLDFDVLHDRRACSNGYAGSPFAALAALIGEFPAHECRLRKPAASWRLTLPVLAQCADIIAVRAVIKGAAPLV